MEKEMIQIDKAELIRLRGVDEMYKMHVAKLGRKVKELDERSLKIIRDYSDKMTISDMYDMCNIKGIGRTAFRKLVINMEVKELYLAGKSPEEIVEALKLKRKRSKMTVDKVTMMLELMGYNVAGEFIGAKCNADVKELANSIKDWVKGSQPTDVVIDEIGFYKVLLLTQMDHSIIYIPFEILKQLRYRIERILDRDMDMTMFVAICTIKIEGVNMIIIGRFESASQMIRVQVIKSSRPQKDKNYDIDYIGDNYTQINAMISHIKL